jgi:hypothetical protein
MLKEPIWTHLPQGFLSKGDMFQDYVVRFSKKSVIFAILGGELGTPTRLSNFVPRTVAWYGYTHNNVVSIPMPYKKDKL